jgi:hypothetical protein
MTRPKIVAIDPESFDWRKHNAETVAHLAKLNGWRAKVTPEQHGVIVRVLNAYNRLYVDLTEAGYEPAFVAQEIWERSVNEWDPRTRSYEPGTDPHFRGRGENPGRIVGSHPVMHYEDYGDDCPGPAGGVSGHPAIVTCAECLKRLGISCGCPDAYQGIHGMWDCPRHGAWRAKNPPLAEDLLAKAVRPCMTRMEANRAASSIERSLRNVERHKVVPASHQRKIRRLLGTARDAKTPRGRIRALSGANRLLGQLRTRGTGSRRPSKGYKPRGPEKDPRLGHLFHGPPLTEAAMGRRVAAGYAANPPRRVHPLAWAALDRYREDTEAGHDAAAEYWRGQAGAFFVQSNPYPHVDPKWKRANAMALPTWAWVTLEVLSQALMPNSIVRDHHMLHGSRPVARITYAFWLDVFRRASEGPVSEAAAHRAYVRWKTRCSDYGLERFDGYGPQYDKQRGWYALDVLGAHDAVWSVLGTPHPLESSLPPYGGASVGEAREFELLEGGLDRRALDGRIPSSEMSVWQGELEDHSRFYTDPSWFVPEGRKGVRESRRVRHYSTYHGGGKERVAAHDAAKGRFEKKKTR